jgi:hypothetical protein
MSNHTPGPWAVGDRWGEQNGDAVFVSSGGFPVCAITGYHGRETSEANARLIAAAPDLLVALKAALVFSTDDDGAVWADSAIAKAEAAIARAEGTAP